MKCVTYNIQYGRGMDGQHDLDRIASAVDGADVIALQEVERFWPRSGNIDQVAYFAQRFSGYYRIYGAGVDLHDETGSPAENRRRQFGNMLLSRRPILHSRHHLLPKHGSIDTLSIQRSAIECTIETRHGAVRIYSIHLTHLSAATRLPQVEALLRIHRQARHEGHPVAGQLSATNWQSGVNNQRVADDAIMLGDFNFQPDSREYLAFVGALSDYGGHITSETGFIDAWTWCGGDKMGGTTSDVKGIPARLDYCFVSTPLRDFIQGCAVDSDAIGSDHRPVWLEMDI